MLALTRETTEEAGISIEHIGDSELAQAIRKTDQWAREYQIENEGDRGKIIKAFDILK